MWLLAGLTCLAYKRKTYRTHEANTGISNLIHIKSSFSSSSTAPSSRFKQFFLQLGNLGLHSTFSSGDMCAERDISYMTDIVNIPSEHPDELLLPCSFESWPSAPNIMLPSTASLMPEQHVQVHYGAYLGLDISDLLLNSVGHIAKYKRM